MTTKDELKKAGVMVLPPVAPEQPESVLIIERLRTLGYEFRLNLCTDTVEVNVRSISDIVAAKIRMQLRDIGLAKKIAAAEDAYVAEAEKNAYHPVRDYLDSLKWDGGNHIAALSDCLESSDPPVVYRDGSRVPLHAVYLHRWLVGAVAKVYTGSQNPMMVWDGGQGIGKSTLAHWIGSGLPGYFIEGPINVSDKDSDIRLISRWVWEVSELDATTRKADQSALKSFITKEVVTVRKAYGHHDIIKPAMASLIGTVNNTSGFLADESGSRRFMITKLDRISLRYKDLDVNQVWAQARALYQEGEGWILRGEEAAAQRARNNEYEVESTLDDWLDKYFIFDRAHDKPISLVDVIDAMGIDGMRLSGSEKAQAMELARVLSRKGARKVETRAGKRWIGLTKRPR
jgi:putative DNA primase/helicase